MEEEKSTVAVQHQKTSAPKASFPRLTLSKVLELSATISELGDGDPVPRLVVFDKLGKSPDSGPSRTLISTSNAYGLTSGSYKAERLSTTELGRSLLSANSTGQRLRVTHKVLLANNLFAEFYAKYVNRALPQEALGVDTLKQLGNLSDVDAKTAFAIFIDNLREQGFVKEMSGRPSILPLDLLLPSDELDLVVQSPTLEKDLTRKDTDSTAAQPPVSHKVALAKTLPQFNFNIQIQLPENGTPENYDAIFKSMSEHLLSYSE